MAMYYYANKLNEASCSANHRNRRVPPAPTEPAPVPPPPPPPPVAELPPIVADPALLRAGNALQYYDNDDYYSMVRGNRFMSESACQHIVMNGGINFVSSQKVDAPQFQAVIAPRPLAVLPYHNRAAVRPDIEYQDGQIVTGTLDALVDMLRPGANKSFKFTFLLCSRLFIKPHELLGRLCNRYFTNYERYRARGTADVDIFRIELEDMVALVSIFSEWTIMFPYDFRDDRVMALVRSITERCAAEHMANVRVEMSTTLEKLLDKLTALEQYEEILTEVPQLPHVDLLPPGDILTLGLTPVELANQLTIVELYKMSFVGPEEFVQTFAPTSTTPVGAAAANTSINMRSVESKCTRNLEGYADWFNRLSYLVATDILKSAKSKYRARVIEQWVMTARECFNLGNFNSLMAIISALNMSPVTRLKKTWSRTSAVCGQQLRQLELCVEPSGNHARYRAALAAAPTETAVPLLSVTCRDLHFANQGAPSRLGTNRVNFEKCLLMSRHVSAQLARRRLTSAEPPTPAPPAPHHAVWLYLNNISTLTELALEMTSFEREPPVDNLEKERLKRLRGAS